MFDFLKDNFIIFSIILWGDEVLILLLLAGKAIKKYFERR